MTRSELRQLLAFWQSRHDFEAEKRALASLWQLLFNQWAEQYQDGRFPSAQECRDAAEAIAQDLGLRRVVPAAQGRLL